GDVDQRNDAALREQPGDLTPLSRVEVGARRIVAATVEQEEVACRCGLQGAAEPLELQRLALLVEVAERRDVEPGLAEDLAVDRPAGRAHPDARAGAAGD